MRMRQNSLNQFKRKYISEQYIFYMAALIGGFTGGYGIMRCGILGSAQTTNLITLVLSLLGRDMYGVLWRLGVILLYASAIVACILLDKRTRLDVRIISMYINAVGIVALSLIPHQYSGIPLLCPVFFMMAFQWNAFPGACGYNCSCIFLTNNFRQMVTGAVEYVCDKNQQGKRRFLFFAGTLVFYFVGIACSFVCVNSGSSTAVLWLLVPVAVTRIMIYFDKKNFVKAV